MKAHTMFDWTRGDRTGVPEVVLAEHKSIEQLSDIATDAIDRGCPLLMTRLTPAQIEGLTHLPLSFDPLARTATLNAPSPTADACAVGIVTAGTSDLPVAMEAANSAAFLGLKPRVFADVGVAGLWRLQGVIAEIRTFPVLIAVAGMEGALFSVLAGLVRAPVIAVPTSVGYGVAQGGHAALHSALASCSPGLVVVNIDNGFGAAAAARKIALSFKQFQALSDAPE
ncbi:nickel pincer cofactor biosynthesis protein LarB [Rhizobium sp. TH2]|uniref:nickel pincer cofactor biosynthesis protein LarB n=1 Tax=Rhizobium sp. TH2 TaxID=2775403 RepID=UPI00215827EB|nr:nickel pincer cofactor biosynthesis protein LarB [Rhizobium sp. TH2]UVC06603.1 nickel pincer cofactor biosynthesis protein LarB [Rhizobium sp. TH2]